jgi:hypothetical protein
MGDINPTLQRKAKESKGLRPCEMESYVKLKDKIKYHGGNMP